MINRKALKNAIAETDYTIVEIARISKIKRGTIYNLLKGTQVNVNTDTLKRLCQTLNVSADVIIGLRKEQRNVYFIKE